MYSLPKRHSNLKRACFNYKYSKIFENIYYI